MIRRWRSGSGTGFVSFPANHYTNIAHTQLSLNLKVCDSPDQAAHYHILGIFVVGYACVPELSWLQSTEGFLITV
jgi:hypothetical protein